MNACFENFCSFFMIFNAISSLFLWSNALKTCPYEPFPIIDRISYRKAIWSFSMYLYSFLYYSTSTLQCRKKDCCCLFSTFLRLCAQYSISFYTILSNSARTLLGNDRSSITHIANHKELIFHSKLLSFFMWIDPLKLSLKNFSLSISTRLIFLWLNCWWYSLYFLCCTLMPQSILCMYLLKSFASFLGLFSALFGSCRPSSLHEFMYIDTLSLILPLIGKTLAFTLFLFEIAVSLDYI